MHLKPGEVVVGRRLYRSGQSEYLINGRVARLRDIQDLFMGIGLGPDSYAIIEQGRIGQILSSKPTDRRAIIEEAAGITKFKTKRRLSEAKLESSKVNLSRINDIYVEVEKQLASLKRQASKARRYAEIREQMRGLLRQVLASKAKELDLEAERLAGLLGEISQHESQEAQSVSQWEAEQERLSARTYELEGELRQHQNVLGQTALELDRSENRILFNRQRTSELTGRVQQLDLEIEQAAAQAAQVETRGAAHGESVTTLRGEVARVEAILANLAAASAELSGAHDSTEARIAALRRSAAELGDELTRLHGDQAQAEQALAHHIQGVTRYEQREQQLLEESLHHRDRAQAADLHWHSVLERSRSLEEIVRSAQGRIAELRREQHEVTAGAESARDALAGGRARRASVEQILNDRSYTADAVQKLFASSQGGDESAGFRAVGVLADYAEVEQQYESAIEQFLRDELEYVVVETFDVARAGIALLARRSRRARHVLRGFAAQAEPAAERTGRAVRNRKGNRLAPRPPGGIPRSTGSGREAVPAAPAVGVLGVGVRGRGAARARKSRVFVCHAGWHHLSGPRGKRRPPIGSGPAGNEARVAIARRRSVATRARGLGSAGCAASIGRRSPHERTSTRAGHGAACGIGKISRGRNIAARSGARRHGAARHGIERLPDRTCPAAQRCGYLRSGAPRPRSSGAEKFQTHARPRKRKSFARWSSRPPCAKLRRPNRKTWRRGARKWRRSRNALPAPKRLPRVWRQELQDLVARRASLVLQHDSLTQEQQQLAEQTAEHQRQVESLRAEKQRLEARGAEMEREFNETRVRSTQADDALRMARQKLGDFREERSKHEIERARNDSEREHLRQSCVEELNAQPEDLIAEFPALLSGEELRASDAQYHELKTRIESMGPINMMALEEYNECEQRFEFLGRERADLLQSITDTQQAITELDLVCKQKFEEAFSIINRNFATAFHTLFGGGTGEMRLSEPDSSGEPGIDVVAQPPGKRLQNVLLLSGGEKAMTALALLIAIFRYQPSPFCILDEVDAPLDEANVGRFTKLVSEMSAGTQFIVVTHNRKTMEMASVLYGVTMQEPGVSKLVSVRWDEPAAAQAATNAA